MMDIREIDLRQATLGVIKDIKYDLAVLPWGATEPHNLHLPYLTDAILAREIALESAEKAWKKYDVRAMVLPSMPLGSQNPGQREVKFCIHYHQETQKAVLRDIVASLNHQGIKRLVIINGHGGNTFKGIVRDLAEEFPDFIIAVADWYKALPAKNYFDYPGDHADEIETSVMMYFHPELTDLSMAGAGESKGFSASTLQTGVAWMPRNWQRVSKDTGIGDPRHSSPEKGKRYADDCTDLYALLFKEITLPDIY